MSNLQQTMLWCVFIGLAVGLAMFAIIDSIHYQTASMEYGEGQVLMLLLDTYPVLTKDARETLVKYLGDGYITQWEYDVILREATRAVFYDLGDTLRPIVRAPC